MRLKIDVLRMKVAPLEWTMYTFEKKGKADILNFLMNRPNRSQK